MPDELEIDYPTHDLARSRLGQTAHGVLVAWNSVKHCDDELGCVIGPQNRWRLRRVDKDNVSTQFVTAERREGERGGGEVSLHTPHGSEG